MNHPQPPQRIVRLRFILKEGRIKLNELTENNKLVQALKVSMKLSQYVLELEELITWWRVPTEDNQELNP